MDKWYKPMVVYRGKTDDLIRIDDIIHTLTNSFLWRYTFLAEHATSDSAF